MYQEEQKARSLVPTEDGSERACSSFETGLSWVQAKTQS
jgi:hypothetical protein